ncbi:MAG TPA: metalloregulator ArsR/SmtB family transcription factor [Solirubrobacteraceae bacterium]|nr:metalloregulator ArsR/SmtB family transcription factor [Solirubrobacteraceae bacterium]
MSASSHDTAPFRLPETPTPVDLVSKYFRTLADPTRLRILELVAERERSVGELVTLTGETQPKISNHLGCLRWCGFVVGRREHPRTYYSIADARVTELIDIARGLLAENADHVRCCSVLEREGA